MRNRLSTLSLYRLQVLRMLSDSAAVDSHQVNTKTGRYFDLAVWGLHGVVADSLLRSGSAVPSKVAGFAGDNRGSIGQWGFTLGGGFNRRVGYCSNGSGRVTKNITQLHLYQQTHRNSMKHCNYTASPVGGVECFQEVEWQRQEVKEKPYISSETRTRTAGVISNCLDQCFLTTVPRHARARRGKIAQLV